MRLRFPRAAFAAALFAGASAALIPAARADVKLPGLISDNMVVQRDKPIHLWGWADENEKVTATLEGQSASTMAGRDGRWSLTLRPRPAGGPYTLTIAGKNTITLGNVLVGEVWVCSGQSNMEFALRNSFEAQPDIDRAANPNLRLFQVPNVRSDLPKDDVAARWKECTPETAMGFSAVGYFFGRDLQKALNVPIGLIQSDWGGTPAEAWTREGAIEANPTLRPMLSSYRQSLSNYWKARIDYTAAVAQARADNKPVPRAPNRPWKPAELYNGMIAPLLPYPIRGALWYQGESNAGRAAEYRTLFPAMIQNWRDDWNQGDFPFLLVQLAPFMAISPTPQESQWAELREAQLHATDVLPNVGMAVITDVGEENDIHPRKKEPVGARLALLARKMVYSENIVASGPRFKNMRVSGNQAILHFDNVGGGLEARGDKLTGFAVRGANGNWAWGDAQIVGDTVVVSSPEIEKPTAVRYGWANYPVVNLWNKAGLPATPFRTDAPEK